MQSEIKWVMIAWAVIVGFIMLDEAYEDHENTLQMAACVNAGGEWLSNDKNLKMECRRTK